jgi:hypothetical protein
MAAQRKSDLHYTGDAKMKAAALKSGTPVKPVEKGADTAPVPSPAKQLQDQLEAHYQPLSRRMSVILVSLLVAFAFVGGWIGGTGSGLV